MIITTDNHKIAQEIVNAIRDEGGSRYSIHSTGIVGEVSDEWETLIRRKFGGRGVYIDYRLVEKRELAPTEYDRKDTRNEHIP
jgi:hypothetical protein